MMDNEQPWQPPAPQKIAQIPKITPQVPDVTLFSPTTTNNKNNFMHRAMASEKVLNIPKHQKMTTNQVPNNQLFNNVKPSVPDVSLFDPPVLNQVNRNVGRAQTQLPTSNCGSTSNLLFSKSQKSSKENLFQGTVKPSVPDITILDEDPKKQEAQANSNNQVFSESYKKMLINSHEQFMKQMKNDQTAIEQVAQQKKKSGLFNKYQDNPLRKYAPKPQPSSYEQDANSSSILVEFEEISIAPETEDKADETTFKKVAEMLSEIQKLVIPGQSPQPEKPAAKNFQKHTILRQLASKYLTKDEFNLYKVEKELKELEKTDDEEDLS
jgi:hypothetical protein